MPYLTAVVLAALLACLQPPAAPAPAQAGPPPPMGTKLTLLTFNIRYDNPADGPDGWPKRRDQVVDLIKDHHPDAVGLQEVLKNQLDDLTSGLPGYGAIGVGRDDGQEKGEYSCILFRKDRFRAEESGTFWLSGTPDVPGSNTWNAACVRVCTWARLTETSAGGAGVAPAAPRSFYLFNTHMDHQSQDARDRGAELIARRMAARAHPEIPAILTGDLNAGEKNSAVMFLTGRAPRARLEVSPAPPATGLVDSFRVAHPDETDAGTFHAFKGPAGDTHRKIDYILVPRGATVLEASIDRRERAGRYPSDHYAVTARVRLSR